MQGFKEFLLRGNLIELAVAFIMGTTFAAVVTAFTAIVMDLIGKLFSIDGFSDAAVAGINLGNFLTALITFVLTAAVLYFAVVTPYNKFNELRKKGDAEAEEAVEQTSAELLTEIRDLLKGHN